MSQNSPEHIVSDDPKAMLMTYSINVLQNIARSVDFCTTNEDECG